MANPLPRKARKTNKNGVIGYTFMLEPNHADILDAMVKAAGYKNRTEWFRAVVLRVEAPSVIIDKA